MPIGIVVWLFFTAITLYLLIFSRGSDLRSRTIGFLTAMVAFVVGITPQSYVWLDTNGTVVSARLLIPEFQPADPLTGQGIIFVWNLSLLVISLIFVMEWAISTYR